MRGAKIFLAIAGVVVAAPTAAAAQTRGYAIPATTLGEAWGRTDVAVEREVVRLADDAARAGLHGVVCSGAEASAVRAAHGDRLALLVPGIRLAGGSAHDQRRVMTPAAAQTAGARYLILGRAVTAAADPRRAMLAVLSELAAGT